MASKTASNSSGSTNRLGAIVARWSFSIRQHFSLTPKSAPVALLGGALNGPSSAIVSACAEWIIASHQQGAPVAELLAERSVANAPIGRAEHVVLIVANLNMS